MKNNVTRNWKETSYYVVVLVASLFLFSLFVGVCSSMTYAATKKTEIVTQNISTIDVTNIPEITMESAVEMQHTDNENYYYYKFCPKKDGYYYIFLDRNDLKDTTPIIYYRMYLDNGGNWMDNVVGGSTYTPTSSSNASHRVLLSANKTYYVELNEYADTELDGYKLSISLGGRKPENISVVDKGNPILWGFDSDIKDIAMGLGLKVMAHFKNGNVMIDNYDSVFGEVIVSNEITYLYDSGMYLHFPAVFPSETNKLPIGTYNATIEFNEVTTPYQFNVIDNKNELELAHQKPLSEIPYEYEITPDTKQQDDYFSFTPTKSGSYCFTAYEEKINDSNGNSNTQINVYDSKFLTLNSLELWTTLEPSNSKQIDINLEANKTYYFKINIINNEESLKVKLSTKLIKEISDIKVSSITLDKKSLKLSKRKSTTLKATVLPSNATNKEITWKSSNTKVATVSNGTIKALNGGTATITASAGEKVARCTVTVPYMINYKLNGGKNNTKNPNEYINKKITFQSPTKKGYLFKGWYTNSKLTKKISSISKTAKKDYTIYAKWEKITLKATKTNLKNVASKKVIVKFNKINGASEYELYCSTNSKFKKANTTKVTTKKINYTFSKLKKEKTYYIKVRAYKKDSTNSKVYGKWSATKKITIKK